MPSHERMEVARSGLYGRDFKRAYKFAVVTRQYKSRIPCLHDGFTDRNRANAKRLNENTNPNSHTKERG